MMLRRATDWREPFMSRFRKRLIIQRAEPVSETASIIAEALQDVAAALCFEAATKYIGTAGEQRQIAAVMFHTCQKRFGGVNYAGQKISHADVETLERMWKQIIENRPRR
jgi:hypothetical protein